MCCHFLGSIAWLDYSIPSEDLHCSLETYESLTLLFSLLIITTSGPLLYCNELHKWVIVGLLTQILIKCSYTRHGFMRAVALLFCKKLWITCLYQKNRVPAFWSFNLWRQFEKKKSQQKKTKAILFFSKKKTLWSLD